ncbi:MAG: tetratricopeptide repeat protein [Deltaproteobacteria bacterium]|nr:tetratricopeptide repeat protein [Deltaproteobacteria bacterium]
MGKKGRKKRNLIGIVLVILMGLVVWSLVSTQYKWKYSDSGLAEYKKGNFQEAIENYARAIESNPDDASLYNNRGLAYAGLKEYEKAISDYDKAIELKPDYAVAYCNRGLSYFKKGSWGNKDPYKRAISDFSKAIELDPDYVDAYYNRGLAYNKFVHYYSKPFSAEDEDKYNKAIADFDKVIELNNSYVLALAGKANAIYRYGNWEEAEKLYNKALQHEREIIARVGSKGLAGVYYSRGRNYMNFIDIRKALSDFKKVIELEPDNDAAFTYIAIINLELEQYEEAIRYANKKIELEGSKKDSNYYSTLGKCHYGLGEYDKAIANLKRALDLPLRHGSKESLRRWLGKAYKESREMEKAKEQLQKAVELLSKRIQTGRNGYTNYQERGLCYIELEQYDKAISDFKKVISLKEKTDRRVYYWNSYLEAHKNVGITYSKMGNKEKAKEYFQITIKLAEERGNNRVIEKTQKLLAEL